MVSDYILSRLSRELDTVFLVYGAAIGELVDAFTRQQALKYVCPMHEQAAGFMAEGFAKIKGFGCAMATSGPGGMNLVTPIGNCYYDSVAAIFITGQVNSRFMKTSPELRQLGFQETHIVGIVTPITKYAVTIKDPRSIAEEMDKAIHLAKSGRPGPVLLDIPIDVQKAPF